MKADDPVLRTKVLIADADADRRAALERALTEAAYEVVAAPSGSFAVTMLEREQPDLVVSAAFVEDMDGYELFSLVREDPASAGTPFLLLAGRDRPLALSAEEAGVDAAVTGDFTIEMVVDQVRALLTRRVREEVSPPGEVEEAGGNRSIQSLWETIEAAGPAPLQALPGAFQGSLGAIDLTEVTQAIALGGKTGCLIVSLTAGQGAILFEAGRIVHAGFQGVAGETAFTALVSAARQEAQARFCFNRADRAAVAHLPKTIFRSVDELLQSLAGGTAEAGANPTRAPGAWPAPRKRNGE